MKSDLYIKVLAVKESALPLVSEIRQRAKVPVLMRKSDYRALEKTALDCFEKDVTACDLFSIVSKPDRHCEEISFCKSES